MKIKKRILGIILSLLTIVNMFTVPVCAAELQTNSTIKTEASVRSIPTGSIKAGTIYRAGGTIGFGRIALVGTNKLYVTLPQNENLDLFQGTITFRSGTTVKTKKITNMSLETWSYSANDIGSGIWTVSVTGYAIGTSQKCDVWYKVD